MESNILDVFNTDAFSLVSMAARFDTVEFVPSQAMDSGIFKAESINTRTATIELRDTMLTIVEPSDRGAPGQQIQTQNRVTKAVDVPHFQENTAIRADQLAGVREFGTTNQFVTVEGEVNKVLAQSEINFAATEELLCIGALQGLVKKGSGGTILDLYAFYGVTKVTNIFGSDNTFDFTAADATTPEIGDGRILIKCHKIVRRMRTDLRMGSTLPRVWCYASPGWMDRFTTTKEVRTNFQRFRELASIGEVGAFLREGAFFGTPPFYYGGIWFEEYRGTGINDNTAIFFPIVQGGQPLYPLYYAPADYFDAINTMGRPRYSSVAMDPSGHKKYVDIETQFNMIPVPMRPTTLYTADLS